MIPNHRDFANKIENDLNHCHHPSHRVCNFLTRPDQHPDDLHEYVSYILTFFSSHMHHLRREKNRWRILVQRYFVLLWHINRSHYGNLHTRIHDSTPDRIEFKLMKTESSYEILLLDAVQLEHQYDSNFLALTSTSTMRPVELRWAHDSGSFHESR